LKKYLLTALVFIGLATPSLAACPVGQTCSAWAQSFGEEFDNTTGINKAPDAAFWNRIWQGSYLTVTPFEDAGYVSAQSYVSPSGYLTMDAAATPTGSFNGRTGHVNSYGKFGISAAVAPGKSLFIEARIRSTGVSGTMKNRPSFWLLSEDGLTTISVMEPNGANSVKASVGGPHQWWSVGSAITTPNTFHTYAVKFEPTGLVVFYYDGVAIGSRFLNTYIADAVYWFMFDNEVPTTGATYPGKMEVDYLRYWTQI
jgi:hypothetical protein